MNNKQQWSTIMQASDERRSNVRGPLLAGIIAGLHVVAISGFLVIQGCGTKQPMVEPPPSPVMPPRGDAGAPPAVMPRPSFQPPVGVEQAPMTIEEASVRVHTVAGGESLARIANRYGVSVSELVQLNGIKDPNKIRVGQSLKLPSYASESAAPAAAPKPVKPKVEKASAPAVAGDGTYVVQSGDSLSKIASRQGTTVKALKEVNNLQSDVIRIGQKLKLPAGAKPAAAKPAAAKPAPAPEPAPAPAPVPAPSVPDATIPPPVTAPAPTPVAAAVSAPAPSFDAASIPFEYTVRPGETIDDIARNFAVLRQDILSMNGLSEGATVSAGQKLKIPMSAP
ncbi:MAG TPA: LysM peptidoglycan-binding domain-containing protein [Kiritimatiellia bacterium]|nr:LysM peptidoglycan-binding domain-containing protein [Kiritimatiellia bacterium]